MQNIFIVAEMIFLSVFKCSSHYISYPAEVYILEGRNMRDIQGAQITANGETQQLQLTLMKNIWSHAAEMVSVRRDKDGKTVLRRKNIPKKIKLYGDSRKGSILRRKGRKLTGILDSRSSIKYEDGKHVITRSFNIKFHESDGIPTPNVTSYIDELLSNKTSDKNKPKIFMLRTIPPSRKANVYEPEIAVLVDSALANEIGSDYKIYEYLTIFWNGVKQRFATIEDPKINIKLVGAVIFRNSSDEQFAEHVGKDDKYFSSDSIMKKLSRWAYSRLETLPDHDILYYQSGKNMTSPKGEVEAKGLSYVRATCKKYNKKSNQSLAVAAGEDRKAFYRGVLTAAHEIAHNLGAHHDFSNADCLNVTGYIMGSNGGNKKIVYFSKCSIDHMSGYLSSDDAACVKTNIKDAKRRGIFVTTKLPGDILNMTEQCRYITGDTQAAVYTKGRTEDSLCYDLQCSFTKYNKEYTLTPREPPAERSFCASGKRCIDGACLQDTSNNTYMAFF